jgi:sulfoxide reductase catalytic subunit YedY
MKIIRSSEITPEHLFLSRRKFITGSVALFTSVFLFGEACAKPGVPSATADQFCDMARSSQSMDELGDALTDCEDVIGFNNFYEFTVSKEGVATLAKDLVISPWTLQVGGLVKNPKTYAIEDLKREFDQEERVYRMRCVEGWSMVIPWLGFPLAKLLKEAEPTSEAKYVRFESLLDLEQMPGQKRQTHYDWPYAEGLRLDEAMNDLTLLSTGLYGNALLPQNGAPIRLVVPWKYGFKSIKSIVKIELVAEQPVTLWAAAAPSEYGFYANVNPDVDHPRWSQASERRIGELGRRETLFLNGYAEEVAHFYAGMDPKTLF